MPLMPIVVGKAIADYFIANAPAKGTAITTANIEAIWEGAITILDTDFQTNAEVLPGSFSNSGGPVVGVGGPLE